MRHQFINQPKYFYRRSALALLLILVFLSTACQPPVETPAVETTIPPETSTAVDTTVPVTTVPPEVQQVPQYNQTTPLFAALEFLTLLDQANIQSLSDLVHPTEGVRFSPYAYVDVQTDQWSDAANLSQFLSGSQALNWGSYDGSGEPILLTPQDYIDQFVYDQAYLQPHIIGYNQIISSGNTLVNIADVYPGATFIEFHFTGFDPQFEGIDWRSLILVLKQDGGLWYIIGVVHSEWTI